MLNNSLWTELIEVICPPDLGVSQKRTMVLRRSGDFWVEVDPSLPDNEVQIRSAGTVYHFILIDKKESPDES